MNVDGTAKRSKLIAADAQVAPLATLTRRFVEMIQQRKSEHLALWLQMPPPAVDDRLVVPAADLDDDGNWSFAYPFDALPTNANPSPSSLTLVRELKPNNVAAV